MFIKKERKKYKDGVKTFIRVVEGFREDGKVKQRSIKSYGFLEDQPNPEAFLEWVKADMATMGYHKDQDITITIKAKDNQINGGNNIGYNYGYKYIESIYDFLDIDTFLDMHQNQLTSKERYRISEIFKFLVLERIMSPGSKRAQVQKNGLYYDKSFDFSLDDVYRSMDLMKPVYKDLQTHMRKQIGLLNISKDDHVYYDVTNYYCEIDFNDLLDGLRKRGVSKEHRLNPIVGLGLFMDSRGLPLSFQIFPGNQAETTTLIPGIEQVKRQNHVDRIMCVADKGLNSKGNIASLIENNDGYLFSQILKGKKGKRIHPYLFDDRDWTHKFNDQGELVYKHKTYTEEITLDKEKKHVQKVLIYWQKKESDMQKKKRDEQVSRAKQALTNNVYKIEHSFKKYIKKEQSDKENLSINYDLINEEERYDGYFCLVTSELSMDHQEMRKTYSNLWEIEDTFRVTKTNLEFRPIYHFKQEHMVTHFLICFTSLLILRLFQYKLKQNSIHLSAERIVTVLNKMKVEKTTKDMCHLSAISGAKAYQEYHNREGKTVYSNQFSLEDQIDKDLQLIYLAFGTEIKEAYVKVENFNRYLRNIRYHTTSA
jgi:transposase